MQEMPACTVGHDYFGRDFVWGENTLGYTNFIKKVLIYLSLRLSRLSNFNSCYKNTCQKNVSLQGASSELNEKLNQFHASVFYSRSLRLKCCIFKKKYYANNWINWNIKFEQFKAGIVEVFTSIDQTTQSIVYNQ